MSDLITQLANATNVSAASSAKRPRVDDGTPQECSPVTLAEGTEVQLEPSSHGAPPPFGGEMPAELVAQTRWVYSHTEPDGLVFILSLPVSFGGKGYPLYYFCGTVPASKIVASKPQGSR